MKDRVPRRLIAMLLGYPLVAIAIALDAVWALLHRGWWPPAVYTLAVAAIACALAACSEHILDLPPAVHVLAVGSALVMANTAMTVAIGEVSRHGRYPGGNATVALLFSFITLTVTTLICHLGETLAEQFHTRHLPARDHGWLGSINAATLPVPRLVQPTLIDADGSRRTLRGIDQFQPTDQHPMTTHHQLDLDWEAMLNQLTEHHATEHITREVVDPACGNQVHAERQLGA